MDAQLISKDAYMCGTIPNSKRTPNRLNVSLSEFQNWLFTKRINRKGNDLFKNI